LPGQSHFSDGLNEEAGLQNRIDLSFSSNLLKTVDEKEFWQNRAFPDTLERTGRLICQRTV
jgi:hypothetical protein